MSVFSKFFIKGSHKIRVEGIKINQFLSDCLKNGIPLGEIKKKDELTIECMVSEKKYHALMKKKYSNQYRITSLKNMGLPNLKREAMQKKGFIIGLLIFLYLMYYQSLFITEIDIKGIDAIDETDFRSSLMEIGVMEGNKKNENLDDMKEYLYMQYEDLAWIGIHYIGNKMVIEIAEKTNPPEIISYDIPCDIVAQKKGYIEEVITKYGTAMVEKGEFVREGDLLITGMVSDEETGEIKYVHSLGEVYAKIIYRINITEEKTEIIKNETGKRSYGLRLKIGTLDVESGNSNILYSHYNRKDSPVFDIMIPFPMKVCLIEYGEIDVAYRPKNEEEIENSIALKVNEYIKKNLPKDAEILNKDLMYEEERNIIKISVIIESLEQIGREEKMIPIF